MILPIDKTLIPYQFEVELNGAIYTIEVHYNASYDFFTLDLYKGQQVLRYGEKIMYGQPLFVSVDESLPVITPLDLAGNEDRVTYDNLGETVFLYVGETNG